MTIDPGMATLLISVILAIIGAAFGYGLLHGRVKTNKENIEKAETNFTDFRKENSEGHRIIHEKLDILIRNGGGGAH